MTSLFGVLKSPFLKFASSELACTVQTPRSNDAGAAPLGEAGAPAEPDGPGRGDVGRPGEGCGDGAITTGGAALANGVTSAIIPVSAKSKRIIL